MVPSGWKLSTVEEIASVSSGGTPSRNNDTYWNGNIPWVTTSEVQFKTIKDTSEKITPEGLANSSAKLFPVDTILMAMYGQGKTRGQVAKLGIEASTNQACAAIVLHPGYEVDYYYQFLVSQYENIREMANKGGQENLSGGIVKSIQVPIPPLPEQRKIAAILSTWDKAITTTEQLLANSQQQKKALMQQLLTGKKRLLDENGERFRGEWLEVKLNEILKVVGGNAFKSEDFKTDGIPLIRISNIKSDYSVSLDSTVFISENKSFERFKVKKGDVLIAMSGATTGKVGCYQDDKISYLNQRVGRFDAKKGKVIKEYLFQLLIMPKIQNDILIDAVGGAQPNISNKDIERIKVFIPSILEQQKIVAVLTTVDEEISALQQKIEALKQEKKGLMQQLLTGKRRVKVDEVAA